MCDFFFQAEDAIRDGHVTGVQTCALPISGVSHQPLNRVGDRWDTPVLQTTTSMFSGCESFNQPLDNWNVGSVNNMTTMFLGRSEERRVGKECRYRGMR